MTVKLVVLYAQPDNTEEFNQHYHDVHVPLVRKLPGLDRFETGLFGTALDGGDLPFHRIAELYFADDAALGAAFGSPEGQATAADYQTLAPPGSRMFIQSVDAQ